MRRGAPFVAAAVTGAMVAGCAEPSAERVTVLAAASLGPALEELCAAFERETGVAVRADLAASSSLARRVQAGAPADVFISANPRWMDALADDGLLVPGSRTDWVGNALVWIEPAATSAAEWPAGISPVERFPGRFALADPAHVPAGLYARQALTAAGWWEEMEPRLIPAPDVRAALALVERGECAAGIVYRTDARSSDRVRVVREVPADLHARIVYPLARVAAGRSPYGEALAAYLTSPAAEAILRRHGFEALGVRVE